MFKYNAIFVLEHKVKITGRTAAAIASSIERQLVEPNVDARLPPVRTVAAKLNVSPATVAAAYKLLQARGLTAGGGRRGTRVVSPAPLPAARLPVAIPDDVVDLASGSPDPNLLPLDLPTHLISRYDPDDRAPLDASLMAFAAMEFDADGIPAADLTVATGALDAIERILWEHLKTGDAVAIEDPTLPDIRELVATSGFVPTPVTVDADGPEPESLARAVAAGCRAVVVTPRAQNPTGAAISDARAADLRRILRPYPDVVVIENDYAAPIAGMPIAAVRGAHAGRWAIVRSTSKFLGPDLRLALVSGDSLTIARVRHRQALGARWVSRIVQRLVLACWSDPSGGRRLARAAETYGRRRAAVLSALAGHGIVASAKSGFNVWLPVREETAVVAALMTRGWAVAAGEPFRTRSQPAIRVTTSALDPADAPRFAADLAAVTDRGRS